MKQARFSLPEASLRALADLAEKRGESIEDTLRHAINTEVYMDGRLQAGFKILSQAQDGSVYKVVFSHMKIDSNA